MITQTINLNLIPGAVPPRINITQYDEGSRTIVCNLYNGTSTFAPSAGATAKVKGTKPDKHGFEYDATISGRTVVIDLTQQMSCVAGDVLCEVELTLGDEVLGTGTFVLRVKASALADDTDISETELPDIIDAARSSAASAAESAESAAESAESAAESAESAAASAEAAQEAANSVSVEYTVTGNPISVSAFPTEADVSMTISPTQSLNGYDKPWAAGAGKNKLELYSGKTVTIADVTVSVTDDKITYDGTASSTTGRLEALSKPLALPAGTYTFSATIHGNMMFFVEKVSDNSIIARTDQGIYTFTLESATAVYLGSTVVSGTAYSASTTYVEKVQIESGSSATAWTPYSNICPITGITTATVQTTDGETTNEASMALGETVFGGSVDFNAGTGTVTMANIASYAGETINEPWLSSMDEYTEGATPTTGAQVVYTLATPTTLSLTPDTLTMLDGAQTVSGNGETVTISYDGNVKQYIDTKVPDAPTTDGTYTLTCVVSGGVPTYSWT